MSLRPLSAAVAVALTSIATPPESPAQPEAATPIPSLEAEADALWERRAEGAIAGRPSGAVVRRLVEAHEQTVAGDSENLRLRWKLLRALHFKGDFAMGEEDPRLAVFEEGRAVADESRALLSARVGRALDELEPEAIAEEIASIPHAIDIYFFSAIHWGLWGQTTGKMKAARQGVGSKIRDFARVVILLDERYESAGGRRFLGRLHTEAPRIPFITGWVDRELAVRELERACRLAPEEPVNLLYLADALLRFDRSRREEAIEILERLVATTPRARYLVEDSATLGDARALLAEAGSG